MKNSLFELTTKADRRPVLAAMHDADRATYLQYAPFIFVCGADESTLSIDLIYQEYLETGRADYECESLAEYLDCITDMGSFTWTAHSLREYLYLLDFQYDTDYGCFEVPHDETIRAREGK